MKRNSIILLSLLILAFTSCKKDPSNTETQATKVEITDADRAVVC